MLQSEVRCLDSVGVLENLLYTYADKKVAAIQATIIQNIVPTVDKWNIFERLINAENFISDKVNVLEDVFAKENVTDPCYQAYISMTIDYWKVSRKDEDFLLQLEDTGFLSLEKLVQEETQFLFKFCLCYISKEEIKTDLMLSSDKEEFNMKIVDYYGGEKKVKWLGPFAKLWYPQPNFIKFSVTQSLLTMPLNDNLETVIIEVSEKLIKNLPNVDPEFVYDYVSRNYTDPTNLEGILQFFAKINHSIYQKRKSYWTLVSQYNIKKDYMANLTIENFVKEFPDPEETFGKEVSLWPTYRRDVIEELSKRFRNVSLAKIINIANKHSGRFLPTCRELQLAKSDSMCPRRLLTFERSDKEFLLLFEIYYFDRQIEIQKYIKDNARNRAQELIKARNNEKVKQCILCSKTDLLPSEMFMCRRDCKEHDPLCVDCMERYVLFMLKEGKTSIPCFQITCSNFIDMTELYDVLRPSILNYFEIQNKNQALCKSSITLTQECPQCSSIDILEDKNQSLFCCKNLACLLVSCRVCEAWHWQYECLSRNCITLTNN